ncbi:short-chain dehydrogenase TIC 32 chloroplastic-like [Trifolium pratense]|uniref:Short-chain dehydrogenase TIC 32 chloroplastic-like n=1 Tax=Trifolium pratense TaxID=57577 RepID=A0A2K3P012_TRIPR|nr:short-chain dehydrogenase TIC 32 chloroplastic-like [Trifolium pratense]
MWFLGWKGPSGFSASSTAEQVTHGIHETTLTAIITGASSGLGLETTRVLALRGVHVVMAVRNVKNGFSIKETLLEEIPTAKIDVFELDLSSLASVRKFAADFNSSGLPLNILIYSSYFAYGQSKLANILHANELARRLKEEGVQITVNSLHPGTIVTNILRHHGYFNAVANMVGKYFLKNVQQGAATQCYLALHPRVNGISGEYFADSNKASPTTLAKDKELAQKLWELSVSLSNTK